MDTTNADAQRGVNKVQHGILPVFCAAVILAQPVFSYFYYHHMLHSDAYPPEADSVGIPIFGNALLWCAWGPILLCLLLRWFHGAVPPLRLFAWDGKRRVFSGLVSVGAAALIYLTAEEIPHDLHWRNYRDLGYIGCWIVFWLVVRSLLLAVSLRVRPERAFENENAG